ncbi:MAG: hypothetical protein DHS20C18_11260 [Saprospiraceae bacterium]|nr:MAG: hypothetical protein DHS20C18_11260 [Saprospiraceae bacterium]
MKQFLTLLVAVTLLLPLSANNHPEAMEPCCNGSPDSSITNSLTSEETTSAVALKMMTLLNGQWENMVYPFEVQNDGNKMPLEGAFLRYEFRADGSYVKTLGCKSSRINSSGSWSVSNDGNHLLLYEDCDKAPLKAKIKYIELDELVLEQALVSGEPQFCTGKKDFFFAKR